MSPGLRLTCVRPDPVSPGRRSKGRGDSRDVPSQQSHHLEPGVLTRTASATMTAATVGLLATLTPVPAAADPAVPGDGPTAVQQLAELNRQAEILTEKWHYARDQLNARRGDLERARADATAATAAAGRARDIQ